MTAAREPIPYDEMTDDQRRAIVEAARLYRTLFSFDPSNYRPEATVLATAVDAATREKPKRYVVEVVPDTPNGGCPSGLDVVLYRADGMQYGRVVEELS